MNPSPMSACERVHAWSEQSHDVTPQGLHDGRRTIVTAVQGDPPAEAGKRCGSPNLPAQYTCAASRF
jgi:hypothetical protein